MLEIWPSALLLCAVYLDGEIRRLHSSLLKRVSDEVKLNEGTSCFMDEGRV